MLDHPLMENSLCENPLVTATRSRRQTFGGGLSSLRRWPAEPVEPSGVDVAGSPASGGSLTSSCTRSRLHASSTAWGPIARQGRRFGTRPERHAVESAHQRNITGCPELQGVTFDALQG